MNLQCAYLRLAIVSAPPVTAAKPGVTAPTKPANDNHVHWPLIPFPVGWYASS